MHSPERLRSIREHCLQEDGYSRDWLDMPHSTRVLATQLTDQEPPLDQVSASAIRLNISKVTVPFQIHHIVNLPTLPALSRRYRAAI